MRQLSKLRAFALVGAAALAIAACAQKSETEAEEAAPAQTETAADEASPLPDYAAVAAAAVGDPRRPEDDRADDARRKPELALEFFQVAPGMTVFEIEAGGGWYTELLSHAVGPTGTVIMQNPEGFRDFVGDKIDARLASDRLGNVRESYSNFDFLDAEDASVDLVTWVQGPHELYFTPDSGTLGDPKKSYAEIYRILKPGGAFVVIDHSAVDGAPETTGNDLHRVDKAIVEKMAEDAGFTLEATSDFLANPEDDRTLGVFDPTIRGYTDQFALRFRKTE
ncbi:MAG: methyltransferase domain-containing protein [Parvularculaceae bacterium]